MLEKYNDTLKVKELCEVLNIGENKAYELLKTKTIYSIRCGRKYIIPKISVINYLTPTFGGNNITPITESGYNSILYSSRNSLSIEKECI